MDRTYNVDDLTSQGRELDYRLQEASREYAENALLAILRQDTQGTPIRAVPILTHEGQVARGIYKPSDGASIALHPAQSPAGYLTTLIHEMVHADMPQEKERSLPSTKHEHALFIDIDDYLRDKGIVADAEEIRTRLVTAQHHALRGTDTGDPINEDLRDIIKNHPEAIYTYMARNIAANRPPSKHTTEDPPTLTKAQRLLNTIKSYGK